MMDPTCVGVPTVAGLSSSDSTILRSTKRMCSPLPRSNGLTKFLAHVDGFAELVSLVDVTQKLNQNVSRTVFDDIALRHDDPIETPSRNRFEKRSERLAIVDCAGPLQLMGKTESLVPPDVRRRTGR